MGTMVHARTAFTPKQTKPIEQDSYERLAFDIGYILRMHRVKQNLTQEEVVRKVGLTRPALSLIESGKRTTFRSVLGICRALGLRLSDLIREAEDTDEATLLAEADRLLGRASKD